MFLLSLSIIYTPIIHRISFSAAPSNDFSSFFPSAHVPALYSVNGRDNWVIRVYQIISIYALVLGTASQYIDVFFPTLEIATYYWHL